MISFKQFFKEALPGVSPEQEQDVIGRSFKQNVISDLLAGASVSDSDFKWGDCKTCPFQNICNKATSGSLVPTEDILRDLQKRVPQIDFKDYIKVDPKSDRVTIKFNRSGEGGLIHVPAQLNKVLGPIIILHEIAHKLYSIDMLTSEIVNHDLASEIFTLARTIEDVRVENLMEQEFPGTASVYKERASVIVPLYKQHTPSKFAKIVDDLFLFLRGYQKGFSHNPEYAIIAKDFISAGNNRQEKVKAVIALAELIHQDLNK